MISTVSEEVGQVPLVIVHWKIFAPEDIAVIPDEGEVGVVIVPVPETKVQTPEPTSGEFPVSDVDEEQSV